MSTEEYDYCSFMNDEDIKYYKGIAKSFEKVKDWLNLKEMKKYIPIFKEKGVWNLEMVSSLSENDLINMGITNNEIDRILETEKRIKKVKDWLGRGKRRKKSKKSKKRRKKSKKRRKKSKKRRKSRKKK